MVKTVIINEIFEGVDAKTAFGILFADAAYLRSFHKVVNGDPEAFVEEWAADVAAASEAEAEGRLPADVPSAVRRTRFRMPLDVPAVVRKLAGGDTVEVHETQVLFVELLEDEVEGGEGSGEGGDGPRRTTVSRSDVRLARALKAARLASAGRGKGDTKENVDGNAVPVHSPPKASVSSSASSPSSPDCASSVRLSYVVRSAPAPQIPGSGRFRTAIETRLEDGPGGASVRVVSACTASGPYGLTGIIEGAMADSSSKTIEKTLEASRRRVAEARGDPLDLQMALDRTDDVFDVLWAQLETKAIQEAERQEHERTRALAARGKGEGEEEEGGGEGKEIPTAFRQAPALPAVGFAAPGEGAPGSASPTSTATSDYLDATSGEFPPLPPSGGDAVADASALYLRYAARTGDQQLEALLAIQQSLARLEAAERKRERSRRRWRRWAELAGAAAAGAATAALALRLADRKK